MKKHFWVLPAIALALTGCGGGSTSTEDTTAPTLKSASTDSTGQNIVLIYDETLSSTTAAASALKVSINGTDATISSISTTGANVSIKLAAAVNSGQTILVSYTAPANDKSTINAAIQDSTGNDAIGVSNYAVTNMVVASSNPSVLINNAAATSNANGEYLVSTGTRVTVTDAKNRIGNNSSSTKDALGNSSSASMNIHTISNSQYDVTFNNGPSGGLTTIEFPAVSGNFAVKLRWQ
ncbi:MAG: SwmB domain-containing protein [Limnohabitans sp.]